MSIKYSLAAFKNPLRPDENPKFYAKAQMREIMDMDYLFQEIAGSTSLTKGDVYNVLRNLSKKIRKYLANGDMVQSGEMDKFQLQLRSTGTETRKEFTFHNIKKAKFQFRPGKFISDIPDKPGYEEIMPVKVRKQTMRELKNAV